MILRLALLGALKHYKRSLVVVLAVAVSCAVMVASGSLLNGVAESFYDSVIPSSGHVRIDDPRAAAALNPLGLSFLIRDADEAAREIMASGDPSILATEPVLSFGALLLEAGEGEAEPRNLAMRGIGVEETSRFADNVRYALTGGSFLPEGRGLLISEGAARLIGTALGRGVVVLVQDSGGQPWYEEIPVTGLFRTESSGFDETTFYIGLGKAREMLDVGSAAREIRVLLTRRDEAPRIAAKIRAAKIRAAKTSAAKTSVTDAGSAEASSGAVGRNDELRVMDWREINASVLSIMVFIKVLMGVVSALFAIVAGTIIANTILMSVLERQREFGAMRAIGLRARSLRLLVMTEGGILGTAGSLLGLCLGIALVYAMAGDGLDLGGVMESMGLSRYNRPRLDAAYFALCAAASIAVSLASTAQAARSVARKSVADSLGST